MIMHALEYVKPTKQRLHVLLWCAQCERRRLREMQLTSQLTEWDLSVAWRGVRQADLARTTTTILTESMEQIEQIMICSVVAGVVDEGYRDRGGFWQ